MLTLSLTVNTNGHQPRLMTNLRANWKYSGPSARSSSAIHICIDLVVPLASFSRSSISFAQETNS